jgi:ubiquinone/menaquinone biosynthesis C-methylase UbiE
MSVSRSGKAETEATSSRGLDGLTTSELRISRQGWWDEAFTQFLLRWIPDETHTLVDVGCGLATAAHALLPSIRNAAYIGIDADENRLAQAAKLLAGTAYAQRVQFQQGRAEQLPCPDATADVALTSMTLQHLTDVPGALSEIMRVMRPGGRLIAIEPDNLTNQFYFDGCLPELNGAFRNLFAAQREARRPADIAIGPAVPQAMKQAGFIAIECHPYLLGRVAQLSAEEFFQRARRVAEVASAAANLSRETDVFRNCFVQIDAAIAAVGIDTVGYSCHLVPVFVSVGEKGR